MGNYKLLPRKDKARGKKSPKIFCLPTFLWPAVHRDSKAVRRLGSRLKRIEDNPCRSSSSSHQSHLVGLDDADSYASPNSCASYSASGAERLACALTSQTIDEISQTLGMRLAVTKLRSRD